MFSLKCLRLREQRRQPLQKFSQKAPQPPALKPSSTARTAGRSDRAERRFRRQPFILCFYRTAFPIQKFGLKSSAFRPKPFPQISPKSYRHNAVPNRFSSRFSTSRTNGSHLFSRVKMGTHSALGERSHTAAHILKRLASLHPHRRSSLRSDTRMVCFLICYFD